MSIVLNRLPLLPRLALFLLFTAAAFEPLLPAHSQDQTPEQAIDYAIVVTGGELLSGSYPDAHTHFLTRTLRPLGLHCIASITVDDRQTDILHALRSIPDNAQLVIVTGGLGPTDNDITREALSEFTDIPLLESEEVLQIMEHRLNKPRAELPANQRRQCLVPARGDFLPNANGTAVGLLFDLGPSTVVALPGSPRELEPMVRDELVPRLRRRFGVHSPGCSLTVRFAGIGQSGIDQAMEQKQIALPADAMVQSQFEGRRVDFTFLLPHDTPADRARLETLKIQLREHLGEFIYAFDNTSLEQLVLTQLRHRGQNLALAEVGSGGALAASLHREPAATQVVAGAYSAPAGQTLARRLHIPHEEWAKSNPGKERTALLAAAASRETGSQWTIAVGEPDSVPGPAGDASVCAVICAPNATPDFVTLSLRGAADAARANLVTQLLIEVWRRLR